MKPNTKAEEFDARAYFLETIYLLNQWPIRAIEQFEAAGFIRVRLEQVEPHPVWELWMKCSGNILASTQAGRLVRAVIEQAGRIPRGGFF